MSKEAMKEIYQLLLTEPHATTVCEKLERIAREALSKQEGQSNFCQQCEALAGELKAIKQEQGEPVARVHTFVGSEWAVVQVLGEFNLEDEFYTTPPQRKPLTDEQIEMIWTVDQTSADDCASLYYAKVIARAIEAAHGIKE